MSPSRSAPTFLAALALAGALLAGPAAGGATAAAKTKLCPKAGATIARDQYKSVRVWRQGGRLRACLRGFEDPRSVRELGPWKPGMQVAIDGDVGTVAWTTPRAAPGGTVDAITTIDLEAGKRWLQTQHAVPATRKRRYADDRVLRLVVDDSATAWVTAGGTVAAVVRSVDDEFAARLGNSDDDKDVVVRPVGRRYLLQDVGPQAAPAVAEGLALTENGETDDCGGETTLFVEYPDPAAARTKVFSYYTEVVVPDPEICG